MATQQQYQQVLYSIDNLNQQIGLINSNIKHLEDTKVANENKLKQKQQEYEQLSLECKNLEKQYKNLENEYNDVVKQLENASK